MTTAAATLARDEAFLTKFRPPELRDLHPELYAAIAREAQRIAAAEWRRRRVERSIARARRDIEAGTFPCTLVGPYAWHQRNALTGQRERVVIPRHPSISEHEPVVCTWMVDVAADESGLASLDAIYALSRQHHAKGRDWNHLHRAGVIGALRSNSCNGLVERAHPRLWRVTDLGRELLDVVFDA